MATRRELGLPIPDAQAPSPAPVVQRGLEAVVPEAGARPWCLVGPAGTFRLQGERMTVGRADGGAEQVSIPVADSSVSRLHAELLATPEGWSLRDLGSTNGTWIGERRVLPGVLYGLGVGDVVWVGEVVLRVEGS